MIKELEYFKIGQSYGGNQDWFHDITMKMGGCAAVTACDSCIYLDLKKETKSLYPFNKEQVTKEEYIAFAKEMKPYLRPRLQGINTLKLYIDGFESYLKKKKENHISLEPLLGNEMPSLAQEKIIEQINEGFLIPMLLLRHQNVQFKDYIWHWFLITGYQIDEQQNSGFYVKIVTYGSAKWLDFNKLWDTGYDKKGGLILFHR